MPESRDCPLCGTSMRFKHVLHVVHVPGHREQSTRRMAEWVCPECDYFEEAEGEGA